jgi:hypothetical protein
MYKRWSAAGATVFVVALLLVAPAASAATSYFNDFEVNTAGWDVFGGSLDATRVASGTNGIVSASGNWHAENSATGSASDWGGYNYGAGNLVPTVFHEYSTSVDIYLNVAGGWANDTRFDFDSAVSNSSGDHRRDFIFNAGFYNDTDGSPGSGTSRFVISASNNSQPGSAYAKNPGRDPIAISTSGWYTFEHHFYDKAGVLAVDLSIYDASSVLVHSWTLSDPSDLISVIGGNRYGWFDYNQFSTLAFDNAMRFEPEPPLHTTGTWAQYPVGAPVYQAQIQQPINSANTSNWSSKSKGGIPVMFKLLEKPGPAAFESILTDGPGANDYAFVTLTPDQPLTFADIGLLKTDYAFALGDCHGGSLRWSVETALGNLFIYYGAPPNFIDCTTNSQSGVNMIGLHDLRYDTSQVGGTFYDTYTHALSLIGAEPVLSVSLVLDSGWAGDQRATITNTTVNDSVYQWDAGEFAVTCDLPVATIDVRRIAGSPTGPVNEDPVQVSLTDAGDAFRVVDCKYQYVLSIPSLGGIVGTYQVGVSFDDGVSDVPTVAQFDLK